MTTEMKTTNKVNVHSGRMDTRSMVHSQNRILYYIETEANHDGGQSQKPDAGGSSPHHVVQRGEGQKQHMNSIFAKGGEL